MFQQLIQRIDTLTTRIALDLRDSFQEVYRDSYSLRGWQLSQSLPTSLGFSLPLLPEQAVIAAMVFPYEGAHFFDRLGDARLDFIRKLRNSMTTSQVLGEGIYAAQKRLANELGWPIGRRTKAAAVANKGNFARTEMIARTELLRSSNLGAAAVDAARADILQGWEWVTARDDRVCPICGPLDGRVWKIGQGERPPKHPRCLPGNALVSSVSKITAGTKRWYEGDMLFCRTAAGNELAVTPNHPILTPSGWIAAKLLKPGSHVMRCLDTERMISASPYNQQEPAFIEQIVDSLIGSSHMGSASVPTTTEDFHGDGMDGQVDIVLARRELWGNSYTQLPQEIGKRYFQGGNSRLVPPTDSLGFQVFSSLLDTSYGSVGGVNLSHSLARSHALPLHMLSLGLASNIHASRNEPRSNGIPGDIEMLSDSILRLSGFIEIDEVINVDVRPFRGHVYNLETESGWYISDNIITHNCRCATIPVRKSNRELGLPEIASEFPPRETYAQWKDKRGLPAL